MRGRKSEPEVPARTVWEMIDTLRELVEELRDAVAPFEYSAEAEAARKRGAEKAAVWRRARAGAVTAPEAAPGRSGEPAAALPEEAEPSEEPVGPDLREPAPDPEPASPDVMPTSMRALRGKWHMLLRQLPGDLRHEVMSLRHTAGIEASIRKAEGYVRSRRETAPTHAADPPIGRG